MIRDVEKLASGDRIFIGHLWYRVTKVKAHRRSKVLVDLEPIDPTVREDKKTKLPGIIFHRGMTVEVRGTAVDELRDSWGV